MVDLVQHRVKYKEIHGVDEIRLMSPSKHKKLHVLLKIEGKCDIPSSELSDLSTATRIRSGADKKHHRLRCINFNLWMMANVHLTERIIYNKETIKVSSNFNTTHKTHLYEALIE